MPPVTAERSPPASRMTGADSPVMADSLTEAIPSITVPSPGMISLGFDHDEVALAQLRRGDLLFVCGPDLHRRARRRLGLRFSQRIRLRLAASLRHGFGEVRKEHGGPQPERDLRLKEIVDVLRESRE